MKSFLRQLRNHKVLWCAFVVICLASFLISVQPVLAGVICPADKTSPNVQPVKHHECCESAARCDCELNQNNSANAPEEMLTLTSSLPNLLSKTAAFSAGPHVSPFIERQPTVETKAVPRAPSVNIYLQTLNLLC
jgi:hypothetical protein